MLDGHIRRIFANRAAPVPIAGEAHSFIVTNASNTAAGLSTAEFELKRRFSNYCWVFYFYHIVLFLSHIIGAAGIWTAISDVTWAGILLIVLIIVLLLLLCLSFFGIFRELDEFHKQLNFQFKLASEQILTEDDEKILSGLVSFKIIRDYIHKEHELDITYGGMLTLGNGWLLLFAAMSLPFAMAGFGNVGNQAVIFVMLMLIYRVLATLIDRNFIKKARSANSRLDWTVPVGRSMQAILKELKQLRAGPVLQKTP